MVEFSLLELREFISITETLGLTLRDYSFISLRLALQRTCADFKIKNFLDFVRQFQQNPEVRKALQMRMLSHPRELLRDAAKWQFVLNLNRTLLSKPDTQVVILDNNFGGDTVSFFLLCKLLDIPLSCTVHWHSFCENFKIATSIVFSAKDLEVAQSNLFDSTFNLKDYFTVNGNAYLFTIAAELAKAEYLQNESSLLPLQRKYDLIISQNNSLKFNFRGHEHFFKSCLSIAKPKAALFFGSKENLKQCSCYSQLLQPKQDINYFINEKGEY